MIRIIYFIDAEDQKDEIEWLKSIRVYPAVEKSYDWDKHKYHVKIGMIVSPDVALLIKLRHPLKLQEHYTQR